MIKHFLTLITLIISGQSTILKTFKAIYSCKHENILNALSD